MLNVVLMKKEILNVVQMRKEMLNVVVQMEKRYVECYADEKRC